MKATLRHICLCRTAYMSWRTCVVKQIQSNQPILMAPKWMREWWQRQSSSHQPQFPEWWENLPPAVQKTARQQHHLCCWGYSHHLGTELLPVHGPSSPRCGGLLSLNVLLPGDRGRRQWEPFYVPNHEPPMVIERQRHTCSLLLDTVP